MGYKVPAKRGRRSRAEPSRALASLAHAQPKEDSDKEDAKKEKDKEKKSSDQKKGNHQKKVPFLGFTGPASSSSTNSQLCFELPKQSMRKVTEHIPPLSSRLTGPSSLAEDQARVQQEFASRAASCS